MDDLWDPNERIVCPYDPVHVISAMRYQMHIVKCRKNHPDKDFIACPFNAKHIFLRPELRSHLARCPDKQTLDADVVQATCDETGEQWHLKGDTSLPVSRYTMPADDEDWDAEVEDRRATLEKKQEMESVENDDDASAYRAWCLKQSVPILRKPSTYSSKSNETVENGTSSTQSRVLIPDPYNHNRQPQPLISSHLSDCLNSADMSVSNNEIRLPEKPVLIQMDLPEKATQKYAFGRGKALDIAVAKQCGIARGLGRGRGLLTLAAQRKPLGVQNDSVMTNVKIGRGNLKIAALKRRDMN